MSSPLSLLTSSGPGGDTSTVGVAGGSSNGGGMIGVDDDDDPVVGDDEPGKKLARKRLGVDMLEDERDVVGVDRASGPIVYIYIQTTHWMVSSLGFGLVMVGRSAWSKQQSTSGVALTN